jgi:lysyl-tRNA synthetase class 2
VLTPLPIPELKLWCPKKVSEAKLVDRDDRYLAIGVPREWIDPLKAMGFTTVEKLKEVNKPGKLANDLNGYKKKNKLDLPGVSPEVVGKWLKS